MRTPLQRSLVVAICLLPAMIGARVADPAQAAQTIAKTAAAPILVNGQGMTLYVYTPDTKNHSNCYGGCAKYWPPVLIPKDTKAPTTMPSIPGTFGVAPRNDGSRQLTYEGAPLYTWIMDKAPGDMTGQGIDNVWWVVGAHGTATDTAAATAQTGTSTGGSSLVKTATASILVNAQGMTLYLFTPDLRFHSVCYGGCAKFWPPALVPQGTQPPATISGIPGTFGVAPRNDGSQQLTYNTFPLYTWSRDKAPGDMTGQGVANIWWVIATGPAPSS